MSNIIKPPTPKAVSKTLPGFIEHCSQFMVEFAGDYLKQNPDGTLINTTGGLSKGWEGQDGQLDFIIDPVTKEKKIRWYGLPRDVNNDGVILGQTAVACPTTYATTATFDPNQLVDVVPLRDVLKTADATITGSSFERRVTTNVADYATPQPNAYSAACMGPEHWGTSEGKYWVGWQTAGVKPSMIRFIIKVEDPSARLKNGRLYQYVMNLK